MRTVTLLLFGLLLAGCGGGISCVSTDLDTGKETCTTYEYSESCPDGETQVENCDDYQ